MRTGKRRDIQLKKDINKLPEKQLLHHTSQESFSKKLITYTKTKKSAYYFFIHSRGKHTGMVKSKGLWVKLEDAEKARKILKENNMLKELKAKKVGN